MKTPACLPASGVMHAQPAADVERKRSGDDVVTGRHQVRLHTGSEGLSSLGIIKCNSPSLLRNQPEKQSLFASLAWRRETKSDCDFLPFPVSVSTCAHE